MTEKEQLITALVKQNSHTLTAAFKLDNLMRQVWDAAYAAGVEDAAKIADMERQQENSDSMTAIRIWGAIKAL